MSDIFSEVDSDLRSEHYNRLWQRYGTYVIAAAVLFVAVIGGWQLWEYRQERAAQATGNRFVAALELADEGNHQAAAEALKSVALDGSGQYPMLAIFRAASEKAAGGDKQGAVAEYDIIAEQSGTPDLVRDVARLRAALILVDTGSLAELEDRIGNLAETGEPWRHSAREILGLAAWRAGNIETARDYFQEISDDQERPAELNARAQLMLALIRSRVGEASPVFEPKGEGEG